VLRLIHNLACKVRLVQLVAPCSADSTLAHQVSLVHRAGASAAWHYKLDMNSLRASLLLPLPLSRRFAVAADRSSAPQCPDAINHPLKYLGRSQADRMVEHHFSCCRRYRNAHQCRPACPYQQSDIRPGSDDLNTSIPGFPWFQLRSGPGLIMMSPMCAASSRGGAWYAKGDPSVLAAETRRRPRSQPVARF
jgi:hypothetical protein